MVSLARFFPAAAFSEFKAHDLPSPPLSLHYPPAWLMSGSISRLVLAIMSKDTRETIERWQFDVKMEGSEAVAEGEE